MNQRFQGTLTQVLRETTSHVAQYNHGVLSIDAPVSRTIGFRCAFCNIEWSVELLGIRAQDLDRLSDEVFSLLKTPEGRRSLANKISLGNLTLPTSPSPSPVTIAPTPLDLTDWRTWAATAPGHCACGIPRGQCDYHRGA